MKELFDKIDERLRVTCPTSNVSRFYSDENWVVIATADRNEFTAISSIMGEHGYALYDIGASGLYLLTYKRNNNENEDV